MSFNPLAACKGCPYSKGEYCMRCSAEQPCRLDEERGRREMAADDDYERRKDERQDPRP